VTATHGRDALHSYVEADDAEARARELHGHRQAGIAQTDHRDARGAIAQLPFQRLVVHRRRRLLADE
jgi:hypothetical protein